MQRDLINVHSLLQTFNPSKFIVYTSVLLFTLLFSLKLDNRLSLPYWVVFSPLWIWKGIAVAGAIVGIAVWFRNPNYRRTNTSYVHFKSMLISISLQLLLLMFEILVCDKLESKRHTWTLVFLPLVFVSVLSLSVCIWSVKNDRGSELEFFAATNILQVTLIPSKLDNTINWPWMVVFMPSWILLVFAIAIIVYAIIFNAIVSRSPTAGSEQRRANLSSASSTSLIFCPLLVFILLLTNKLDSPNTSNLSYFTISTPLFLDLIILTRLSFGSKHGSLWWFGMRSDFCTFLLSICPALKEYCNISYNMTLSQPDLISDLPTQPAVASPPPSYVVSNHHDFNPNSDSNNDTSSQRDHSVANKLISSIRQVFVRDKSQSDNEKETRDLRVIHKLSLDVPD